LAKKKKSSWRDNHNIDEVKDVQARVHRDIKRVKELKEKRKSEQGIYDREIDPSVGEDKLNKMEVNKFYDHQRCKCGNKPTRWYKLMSQTVYRCEAHKREIFSPVYDQGRISSRGELIGFEDHDIRKEQGTELVSQYRHRSKTNFQPYELEQENEICTEEHDFVLQDDPDWNEKLRFFIEHLRVKHPKNFKSVTYYENGIEHNLWLEHPEEYFATMESKANAGKPIPKEFIGTDFSSIDLDRIPPEHLSKVSGEIMEIKETAKNDYEKYDKINKLLEKNFKKNKGKKITERQNNEILKQSGVMEGCECPPELGEVFENCETCRKITKDVVRLPLMQKKLKKHFKSKHSKFYPLFNKYSKKARSYYLKTEAEKNVQGEVFSAEVNDEKLRMKKAYQDAKKPDGSMDTKKLDKYFKNRIKELKGHVKDPATGKCKFCGSDHDEFTDAVKEKERFISIVDEIGDKIPEELLQYNWEDKKIREKHLNHCLSNLFTEANNKYNFNRDEQEMIAQSIGLKFVEKRNNWLKKNPDFTIIDKITNDHSGAPFGEPKTPKSSKPKKRDYPPYEEARLYALDLDCRSQQDWINHTKTDEFDVTFPLHPHTAYKPEFHDKGGYPFFLGYTKKKIRPRLTHEEIQKIVIKFHERWITDYKLYPDAFLMRWFEKQGLFRAKDPLQATLFKNFVSWRNDPQGIKAIRFYFNGIITGDLSKLKEKFYNPETDRTFSLESRESYIDRQYTRLRDVKPQQLLENIEPVGVEKVMAHAVSVVPDEDDRDWWNFQLNFSVKMLWYAVFDEETGKAQYAKILNEKKGKNKFHDAVLDKFLKEYKSVTTMSYKERFYTYKKKPQLNQLYCAWIMRHRNFFFDMSSTGTGKTGCGLVSAMSQNVERCVIICPKNIVVQWHNNVKKFYNPCWSSNSEQYVTYIPNEFFSEPDKKNIKTAFHVINYDKFNNATSANRIIKQFKLRNNIGMVILDESHRVKSAKEDEKEDTATRRNVSLLINALRKDNRKLKVLMLSATPVINRIVEGKGLLEMGTGTDYSFSTYPTVLNASKLYTEFQPYCMRWVKKYPIEQKGRDDPITIRAYVPEYLTKDQFSDLHWDDFDQFNTQYRISTILSLIRDAKRERSNARIIVYTDYIDGIVDQLQVAFNDAGLRYGLFIGADKSGMIRKTGKLDEFGNEIIENPFNLGELDVLIASSPIAVGVDDLQYGCNTVIFNGLVWTWAKFEQIVGRLVRTGQVEDHVNIHLVFANLNGYEYDYKVKYLRILAKKSIGDCVTTGTLPPKISLGSSDGQRLGMIEKMWNNKESGFPEKELIVREQQKEAQEELEEEIEKTNEFLETIKPIEKKLEDNSDD